MCPPLCCSLPTLPYCSWWGIFISHFVNKQSGGQRGWKSLDAGEAYWLVVCVGLSPRAWLLPWQCGGTGQAKRSTSVWGRRLDGTEKRGSRSHTVTAGLFYFVLLFYISAPCETTIIKKKTSQDKRLKVTKVKGKCRHHHFLLREKWGWWT